VTTEELPDFLPIPSRFCQVEKPGEIFLLFNRPLLGEFREERSGMARRHVTGHRTSFSISCGTKTDNNESATRTLDSAFFLNCTSNASMGLIL